MAVLERGDVEGIGWPDRQKARHRLLLANTRDHRWQRRVSQCVRVIGQKQLVVPQVLTYCVQAAADIGMQPRLGERDLPITRLASQLIWRPAIARENEPVDHITATFLEE